MGMTFSTVAASASENAYQQTLLVLGNRRVGFLRVAAAGYLVTTWIEW